MLRRRVVFIYAFSVFATLLDYVNQNIKREKDFHEVDPLSNYLFRVVQIVYFIDGSTIWWEIDTKTTRRQQGRKFFFKMWEFI